MDCLGGSHRRQRSDTLLQFTEECSSARLNCFYLLLFYQLLDGDKLAVPTNGCNVGHAREGMRPNANYMVTMTGRPVTKVLESITPRQSVHTLMHPIIEVTAWGADWRLQVAVRNNEGFS